MKGCLLNDWQNDYFYGFDILLLKKEDSIFNKIVNGFKTAGIIAAPLGVIYAVIKDFNIYNVIIYGVIVALICCAGWLIYNHFFIIKDKNVFIKASYTKLIKCLKKRAKQFNAANPERSIDINTIGDHEAIIRLYGKGQDKSCRIVLDYLYDGQAIKVLDTQDKDYYQAAYYAKANDGELRLTDGINDFADVKLLTDRIWKDFLI